MAVLAAREERRGRATRIPALGDGHRELQIEDQLTAATPQSGDRCGRPSGEAIDAARARANRETTGMIPKLVVYHRPLKRWPKHPCVMNSPGFAYQGWTGDEWFGVIKPYRYYGWRVTC